MQPPDDVKPSWLREAEAAKRATSEYLRTNSPLARETPATPDFMAEILKRIEEV